MFSLFKFKVTENKLNAPYPYKNAPLLLKIETEPEIK